jgi:hypothetical protein
LFPLLEVRIIKLEGDEVCDLVALKEILVRHGSKREKLYDTMKETKREGKVISLISES